MLVAGPFFAKESREGCGRVERQRVGEVGVALLKIHHGRKIMSGLSIAAQFPNEEP